MKSIAGVCALSTLALLACAGGNGNGAGAKPGVVAPDGSLELADPVGDDNGPGTYVYPTDPIYKKSAFDLVRFQVIPKGDKVELRVTFKGRIEDPWDSKTWGGNGFSLQMAFVHIDMDHVAGSGETRGIPGTNVRFKADEAWDKVVVLSPQGPSRLNSEIDQKAADMKARIIVPTITRSSGKTLIAVVTKDQLGAMPAPGWGYQVLIQSNEGYPAATDLLTRKINEFEGEHRFGGGSDYDNDPHVLDMLAPSGVGAATEVTAQHEALSGYNKQATEEVKLEDLAEVPMVYPTAG